MVTDGGLSPPDHSGPSVRSWRANAPPTRERAPLPIPARCELAIRWAPHGKGTKGARLVVASEDNRLVEHRPVASVTTRLASPKSKLREKIRSESAQLPLSLSALCAGPGALTAAAGCCRSFDAGAKTELAGRLEACSASAVARMRWLKRSMRSSPRSALALAATSAQLMP